MRQRREPNLEEREQIERAAASIRDIDSLKRLPAFCRFMEQIERRAAALAESVLEGNYSPEEREQKRLLRLGIKEVLKSIDEDRHANARLLETFGLGPGHPDED